MARINIEDCWWTDPRRERLGILLGNPFLADAIVIRAWRVAQEFWGKGRQLIPKKVWNTLEGASKLLEVSLAEEREGGIYACGSSQYLEWVIEQKEKQRAGGLKSAKTRREKYGTAQPKPKKPRSKPEVKPKCLEVSVSGSFSDSDSDSGSVPNSSNSANTGDFIAAYCERFKSRWGNNPPIQGKDQGIVGRLKKTLSLDTYCTYLDAYFTMPDAGVVKAKHPLNLFELKLNEVVVFAKSGRFTTNREAHQADNMATNVQLLQKIRAGEL